MVHFKPTSDRGRNKVGVCGLCRETTKLSDTHVPPKACGNDGPMRSSGIDLDSRMAIASRPKQGGVRGFFLCQACNGATGKWDEDLIRLQKTLMHGLLHERVDQSWTDIELSFNDVVRGGRLARAVCAGMFAMNETLAQDFPATADSIISGMAAPRPSSLHLHMALTTDLEIFALTQRGATAARIDTEGMQVEKLPSSVVHVPPMCFMLTESGCPTPESHSDVSHLLEADVNQTCRPVDLNFATLAARPGMTPVSVANYAPGHSDLHQWIEVSAEFRSAMNPND